MACSTNVYIFFGKYVAPIFGYDVSIKIYEDVTILGRNWPGHFY